MKFGLFYLAQYVLNFLLCAMTVIIFWGGWQGPGVTMLYDSGNYILAGILGVGYFLAKTYFFFFVMVWLRGVFPRLRIDQLMGFGWKFLIPLTLVNVVSASLWVAFTRWGAEQGMAFMDQFGIWPRWGIAFGVTLVINVAAYLILVHINHANTKDIGQLVEDQKFGAVTLP
jgi:NADH-quinone oxidoreductase subunit H